MTTNYNRDERVAGLLADTKPVAGYKETFIANRSATDLRISTGSLLLDRKLNGGLFEELYILAAETSTGKSAFMMSIAQRVQKAGLMFCILLLKWAAMSSLPEVSLRSLIETAFWAKIIR